MTENTSIIEAFTRYMQNQPQVRFRDKRAWHASDLLRCSRDVFWRETGVPRTNPTDFIGNFRMLLGKAIEQGVKQEILNNLHLFGYHSICAGSQVSVGFSDPIKVDGYVDDVLVHRIGDVFGEPFILEIKTKYGAGADFFSNKYEVGDNYLAQTGAYLYDLYRKKGWTKGKYLFILLSDRNFGTLVEIDFEYLPKENIIKTVRARNSQKNFVIENLHESFDLTTCFKNRQELEKIIERGEEPTKGDYQYRYPITSELIAKTSDSNLQKVLEGKKILGDWQPRYSDYFDLQLKRDKLNREYSNDEMKVFAAEWRRRHPKSKKFLQYK